MAAPREIAIIYGEESKLPRRVIFFDGDANNAYGHIGPGEAYFVFESEGIDMSPDGLKAIIAQRLNLDAAAFPVDQCAVVCPETGIVKDVIKADPIIDSRDDGDLIVTATASVNDKFDGQEFLSRFAVSIDGETVMGFIWDTALPRELAGMALPDSTLEVGDAISFPQPFDVPASGVEEL